MYKSKTAEIQSQREYLKSSQKTRVTFSRRHCNEIFKMLNKNTCQPRISYLQNTSFQNEYNI